MMVLYHLASAVTWSITLLHIARSSGLRAFPLFHDAVAKDKHSFHGLWPKGEAAARLLSNGMEPGLTGGALRGAPAGEDVCVNANIGEAFK